jgi:hypothetical protein
VVHHEFRSAWNATTCSFISDGSQYIVLLWGMPSRRSCLQRPLDTNDNMALMGRDDERI